MGSSEFSNSESQVKDMKTKALKFRMRLLDSLFAISIALLLLNPTSRPSAETPQGKGGEVVAKPAKPRETSRTPSRSRGKTVSLEGTVWDFKGNGDDLSYEFMADGELTWIGTISGNSRSGKGTWKQNGTRVVMTFGSDDEQVETGTVFGNRMNGTGTTKDEGKTKTYRWSAKRSRDEE